jgi:hypothetical protein
MNLGETGLVGAFIDKNTSCSRAADLQDGSGYENYGEASGGLYAAFKSQK